MHPCRCVQLPTAALFAYPVPPCKRDPALESFFGEYLAVGLVCLGKYLYELFFEGKGSLRGFLGSWVVVGSWSRRQGCAAGAPTMLAVGTPGVAGCTLKLLSASRAPSWASHWGHSILPARRPAGPPQRGRGAARASFAGHQHGCWQPGAAALRRGFPEQKEIQVQAGCVSRQGAGRSCTDPPGACIN